MTGHVRGWTARVGLRKPGTPAWARSQLNDLIRDEWDELIESAHLTPAQVNAFQPWVNAEWAGAILGQMHDALTEAMERPIDHDVIKGTRVRNAAVSPPIPPPNPLLAATDYGTCCGYRPGTACDCPDDSSLDALVERQEQRRGDESHGKPRPQAGVRYRPVKGALLGPGSGIETPEQAERIVNALRGRAFDGRPCAVCGEVRDDGPVPDPQADDGCPQCVAIRAWRACPRPCCHTTGPNHHPACQDNRTGTEQT
jgi:hypothetical protein